MDSMSAWARLNLFIMKRGNMQKIKKGFLIAFLLLSLLVTSGSRQYFQPALQNKIILQITQVDTSEFPVVRVYVSVRDEKNEPLPINPGRLILKENGKPVDVQDIQGSQVVNELTSMLVLDISGSMNFAGKLEAAKLAAKDFIRQLRTQDKAGIITFNTKVNLVNAVTSDHSLLLKSIDRIQARDDTAMYDALIKAVELLNPLPGRKAIIVLTDGMDNESKATPDQVLHSIGYTGLSISTIGLGVLPEGEKAPDQYKGLDQPGLTMLAEKAGGRYGFVEDNQALTELYDQMRRALQSEIVITYTTPQKLRDGVSRSLTVELADDLLGAGSTGQKQFNPGGLVPEVANPVSWTTFTLILLALLVLLFIPWIVSGFSSLKGKGSGKKKPRIKLLD
jgi:Ca-activated chloride channel homolog